MAGKLLILSILCAVVDTETRQCHVSTMPMPVLWNFEHTGIMVNFAIRNIILPETVKKVLIRAASGSIYVALIVAALLLQSPYMFICLFALFIVLGIIELHHLVDNKASATTNKRVGIALDCLGGLALFATFTGLCSSLHNALLPVALVSYLAYFALRMILQLYMKSDNALQAFAGSCLTQLYVALPLSLLNILYFEYGAGTLLAIFIMIWLNDTGAFCVGSLIGRHRLFERISPKKSWEGFWGGMAFCIIAGIVFHYVGGIFGSATLAQWICLGIIVSAFSTWGDLAESLLKRTLNVKDSGNIIPGHGGILDRIDSLLLVAPVSVAFFIIIEILS